MKLPDFWPVTCHTRYVGPGSTFVAIKGQKRNGIDFIAQALRLGAKKIVVASDANLGPEVMALIATAGAQLERVDNTRRALAEFSAQAHSWPARKLKIIGITGTKGKTTTACATYHMLRASGYSVALISTVYNAINDHTLEAELTTPQPDYLHMFFNTCVQQGVEYVVMEVAAQAVSLHRVDHIFFDAVAFTNFGHEHREFYDTFDDYFNAKVKVITRAKFGAPIFLNADDARVCTLAGKFADVQLVSMRNQKADWCVQLDPHGDLRGTISAHGQRVPFSCPTLLGEFNGANLLMAAALAYQCGLSLDAIAQACATMPALPGRLERYQLGSGVQYIIDYAHTPASYEQLLSLLRTKTRHLIVIFGAGGERDHLKRPIMGAVAAQYADRIILTADNPRSEDPHDITVDIMQGIDQEQKNKVLVEIDREKAIKMSYQLAEKGAIIALLGKGPDEYQLIQNTKIPFSEKAIIKQLEHE